MKVRPALLLHRRGQVLLLRYRYTGADVYALPGGNPDPGETLAETLRRELLEELGLLVQVGPLVLLGEVLLPGGKPGVLHCVFAGEIEGTATPQLDPAHTTAQEIVWLPGNELPARHLYPNVGAALAQYFAGTLPQPYLGQIDQPWVG